ncbi:hypothetical protein CDAR_82271 [Caerostris darwini]|uniref:Uncharacterized protein n=1 Tax=Caerostris darwini TaxID=1538125 RepID=A0AAV4QCX2_9ARAC|nr:hypothetical protein CDAR_82271 [Caerostris darwini]
MHMYNSISESACDAGLAMFQCRNNMLSTSFNSRDSGVKRICRAAHVVLIEVYRTTRVHPNRNEMCVCCFGVLSSHFKVEKIYVVTPVRRLLGDLKEFEWRAVKSESRDETRLFTTLDPYSKEYLRFLKERVWMDCF